MSTMQSGQFGQFPEEIVEQRTSVMAILSLVFGLLCVPGFGILGAIFGIAALFGISGSRGRVTGKGLAIAGLVVSLLVSALWLGAAYAGMKTWGFFKNSMIGPMDKTMLAIQTGDGVGARQMFKPETAAWRRVSCAFGLAAPDRDLARGALGSAPRSARHSAR